MNKKETKQNNKIKPIIEREREREREIKGKIKGQLE